MGIINKMDALLSEWQQQDDRRAEFLRCYRMMTGNMLRAIDENEFHDGPWVRLLLQRFASYYFAAIEQYEQNQMATPAVWLITHRYTCQADSFVLQNLLLGINAHINYDLVLTLYDLLSPDWSQLTAVERQRRYADHCRVNDVIGRTIDRVQDEIIEKDAPLMDIFDKLLGPVDEWSTSHLISDWREGVWQHALRMVTALDAAELENQRQQTEALTLRRAQRIINLAEWPLVDLFSQTGLL